MGETISNFIRTYWRYIVFVLLSGAAAYLNYNYISISTFNKYKEAQAIELKNINEKYEDLKEHHLLHVQKYKLESASHDEEVATNKRRLENKIEIQGKITNDVINIRIEQAKTETKVDLLMKNRIK